MSYLVSMNIFEVLFVMGCHSFKVKQFICNLLLLSVLFVNNMSKSVTSAVTSGSEQESLWTIDDVQDYKFFDVKERRELKRAIMQGLGLKHKIDIKRVSCY